MDKELTNQIEVSATALQKEIADRANFEGLIKSEIAKKTTMTKVLEYVNPTIRRVKNIEVTIVLDTKFMYTFSSIIF